MRAAFAERAQGALPPLAALAYPSSLAAYSAAQQGIAAGNADVLPWLSIFLALLFAHAVPLIALVVAVRLSANPPESATILRAKRIALVAVAAPPIFVTLGVVLDMAKQPGLERGIWQAGRGLMLLASAWRESERRGVPPRPPSAPLRVAHGISALAIVVLFLGMHLTTHMTGLAGPEFYMKTMRLFRHVYRSELVQPLIVGLFLFMVASGLWAVWRRTTVSADWLQTLQSASGVYVAFFVLGHMNSVFVYARRYLQIDTDWNFATGAPRGMLHDVWGNLGRNAGHLSRVIAGARPLSPELLRLIQSNGI